MLLWHIGQNTTFNEVYDLGEMVSLLDSFPSGHILNSAQLELWITQNNVTRKLAYTSDLGNVAVDKHYITKFQPVEQCDLLIGESTYSDKTRSISQKRPRQRLGEIEVYYTGEMR